MHERERIRHTPMVADPAVAHSHDVDSFKLNSVLLVFKRRGHSPESPSLITPTPFNVGIRKSRSDTSGRCVFHNSTASRPLLALATTVMSSCRPIVAAKPSRISAWSSAMSSRIRSLEVILRLCRRADAARLRDDITNPVATVGFLFTTVGTENTVARGAVSIIIAVAIWHTRGLASNRARTVLPRRFVRRLVRRDRRRLRGRIN